jgi:hypothetical protein
MGIPGKKVNVKVMEKIDNRQVGRLIEGLKKTDGFDFQVDTQFEIYQTHQDGKHN